MVENSLAFSQDVLIRADPVTLFNHCFCLPRMRPCIPDLEKTRDAALWRCQGFVPACWEALNTFKLSSHMCTRTVRVHTVLCCRQVLIKTDPETPRLRQSTAELRLSCFIFRWTQNCNIYNINEVIIQPFVYNWMNKLFSVEYKVPRTLSEARKVAGSATYKQSKKSKSMKLCFPLRSVCLFSLGIKISQWRSFASDQNFFLKTT